MERRCGSACRESKRRARRGGSSPLLPCPPLAGPSCPGDPGHNRTAESTVKGRGGARMPWGRVGPAHTQRERTKTSEGEEERNTEESTYNRKQRNFTCSVVLMHQSTDRERDRQMERRRACEKTWIVTLIWRSTASCPALAFWKEHRDQRCSDSASAVRGGGVRLNRKSHRRGGASARSGPCCSEVMGREPKNPPLLPLPASSRSPRSHTGAPTLKESLPTLRKIFLRKTSNTKPSRENSGYRLSLQKPTLRFSRRSRR